MTSTISDEQALAVADSVARDLFDGTWTTEHQRSVFTAAGRRAIKAYDRTRASDPRVVALIDATKDAVCALEVCGKDYPAMEKARAALAAMEKKE